jgi:spore germination cell wall hydrolase CwlJ-like protein
MDDATLLAVCIWSEAAGEPVAGKRAVAQVILNRMHGRYQSDGTVAGTILWPNQFSGFWFEMRDGRYTRVCWTREDAEQHAQGMLLRAQHQAIWDICMDVAEEALNGSLPDQPSLDKALLYLNPAILPRLPAWASPDKQLCAIGAHTFYRA